MNLGFLLVEEMIVRFVEWSSEYDAGGGPNADAEGNVADNEQMLTGLRAKFGAPESRWKQTVNAQYSTFERTFEDSWGITTFDGENLETEWRHDLAVSDEHNLSVGLSYRDESAESESLASVSADNRGAYLQDQDGDNYDEFIPINDPRVFGQHRLFRIGIGWMF